MHDIIESLFKKNAKQTTEPNAASTAIVDVYKLAAEQYSQNISPLEYKNRRGIFGFFKDEVAHFSVDGLHTPDSLLANDTTSYGVSYSATKKSFTTEMIRRYELPHPPEALGGGMMITPCRRPGQSVADVHTFLGLPELR